MRILILVDRYKPSPISGARMMEDLAIELYSRNNTISVISTDHKIDKKFIRYKESNIDIIKVKSGKINHSSKIVRTFIESTLSLKIWHSVENLLQREKFDLVICYSPTIFWGGLVKRLKLKNDCKFYLVLRDLFPHWLVDAKIISKYNPIYYYFLYIEKILYAQVDRIGVQSPTNLEFFRNNKQLNKFEVLYNWTKPKINIKANIQQSIKDKIKNKLVLVYGGNIGVAQDINNILRLARNLIKKKDILFLLIGDGTEYENIEKEIKMNKISNVLLSPSIKNEEYQSILNECSIGLVSLNKDLRTENLPGKMLEYMKYSLPILASINMGNNFDELIHKHEAGLVSLNGDDEKFLSNALQLIDNPDLRSQTSQNSKNLLYNIFHVKSAADKILKILD